MKKTTPKLIIIDGNAIIHRSFHALPPTMTTKSGQIVNAVYGFSLFLLKALTEFQPEYVALTFDRAAPTFRHKEYVEYKATRTKAPDELYDQIPYAKKVATALNIPIFELDGYEADDLIGTIVNRVDSQVEKIIITGDMDTLQLINDHTKVYTMSRGLTDSVLYDADLVKERYGVTPKQIIDYKALRGDVSDNIPGVKGIGEKTASELLQKFKTLDGVYQAAEKEDQKIKERTLELLITHKKEAYLSQKLATIEQQAPIKFALDDCRFQLSNRSQALELFSELEFKSLIPKLNALSFGSNVKEEKPTDKFARDLKQFNYHLISSEKELKALITKLKTQKLIAIDTETTSLDPLKAEILGISLSYKEKEAYYIPIYRNQGQSAHPQAPNLFNQNQVPAKKESHPWLKLIAPILADEKIKKGGHNLKYDLRILENQGLEVNGLYLDSMIASYLLNPENRQHGLDALSFNELGLEKINHKDLFGEKEKNLDFSTLPLEKLYIYACEDADCTFRLLKKLEARLKKEKLFDLCENIEMPLIKVLAHMEDTGILIAPQRLSAMAKILNKKLTALEKEIHILAKEKFNINSPKQLKEILFDKLALETKGIKKTKTGISTAAEELEKLKDLHPIIPLIQEQRELSKLLNTYIEALPELINPRTKRIHTSFNQTIAATGRLSSTDPNLQNIPARTELGQKIRTAFIAPPGYKLLSLDYSQVELRLAASMSGDKKMIQAFLNNVDIHTTTAAAILGLPLEKVTPALRREAKAVNFGIIYGQGPHGLSQSAGIPYNQAREFIEKYFSVYSGVKKFLDQTIAQAKKEGYVETLFGRRRYLPEINSSIVNLQKSAERMAVNTPFQGTAADMIKLAMIKIAKMIDGRDDIKMILQVHDELMFEIKEAAVSRYAGEIKKIMEEVIKLKVPIIADIKIGDNWGEMEK
ncbi:MAG TPA: DNA polymerase I [bacterium]|nr:DNA polymerase I [bacterium]HPT29456.1 DNA polymerase I [bacterium]